MLPDRNDLVYESTKTYVHAIGLSCCFRQWRAESHCRFLHGYALEVKLTFVAKELDVRNWVVDFGSLKPLKGWLEDMFDHKLLIAEDDPCKDQLVALSVGPSRTVYDRLNRGTDRVADVRVVPATGCEAFARFIFEYAEQWLIDNGYAPRVSLEAVEVREHAANSAVCRLRGAASKAW
jgi:6-pyruvoyltetrahydropterin/6-carboxytetrahydropterin synthase